MTTKNKEQIQYSSGYKYALEETYSLLTPITGHTVGCDQYLLRPDGSLTIAKGFPWDGPSGITYDTSSSLRASLIHDVFCLMMRNKSLPHSYRHQVNEFFKQLCIEDGMWGWRAHLWFLAVEAADCGNPDQGPDRIVKVAP